MVDKLKEVLKPLLERVLASEGAELADLALSRYKNNLTLRLFVYSQSGPGVDECARLSRIVGAAIDESGFLASGYALEVSSPGLDRPLTAERDFRYRQGEKVQVTFVDKKKRKLTARIVAVSSTHVDLKNESETISLNLSDIEQARIVF
jgi:ribosome maturation factor RimP